jgi:hypothetical protein
MPIFTFDSWELAQCAGFEDPGFEGSGVEVREAGVSSNAAGRQ